MIHTIVFDLGNVLLYFDHSIIVRRLERFSPVPISFGGIWEEMKQTFERFERGEIAPSRFYEICARRFQFEGKLSFEEFAEAWSDIFWRNELLVRLLPLLKEKYNLVMLSNTNALHIDFAERAFPEVFQPFDACVYSHETGAVKPEEKAFSAVRECGQGDSSGFLYFDDIGRYTEAAGTYGFHGYQYTSYRGVLDILSTYTIEIPEVRTGKPGA